MFGLRLGVIDRATFRAKIEHIFILRLCGRVNSRINRGAARITDRPGGKPLTCAVIGIVCIAIGSIVCCSDFYIFPHYRGYKNGDIRALHLPEASCPVQGGYEAQRKRAFYPYSFSLLFNDRSER